MVTRARQSFWTVLILMLLADSVMSGVRVARVARERRQVEDSDQEEESELGRLAKLLDEIEESLLSSLESMIVNQEAQDRILLEDVQVTIIGTRSPQQLDLPASTKAK